MNKALDGFLEEFLLSIKTKKEPVEQIKKQLIEKYKIKMMQNSHILWLLKRKYKNLDKKVIQLLRTRLTRTGSGVSPVAIMPKPFPCPGRCTYCPQGENAPKSYTGFEPATMRAIRSGYSATKQIHTRLEQYAALGQPNQKCELIIMGGTFLSVPLDYQYKFIKECYDAFNFKKAKNLKEAKELNETANHRVVGLTIETRPDWCKKQHIDRMLEFGATRVELGVQSLDDKVLKKVQRGHGQKEIISATSLLKDSAFKVCYHFMPGLYSTKKKDIAMFRKMFEDQRYRPDMLKIYPCLVMPGTKLYEEYKKGEFSPIDNEEAVERIALATKYFPPWLRVMRMQRDIPANKIEAGVKAGNLHQMVQKWLEQRGQKCRCIRCREVFSVYRKDQKNKLKKLELDLIVRKYKASYGIEYFISYEDKELDLLAGFIRLRLPFKPYRKEIDRDTALIRELHIYGSEVEIGKENKSAIQHKGLGRKLLEKAEEIALKNKKSKMIILAGVGVRKYYKKFGYELFGPYMFKNLEK
ncbi:MAG: tRNA uridine(34) 5-carboxymethylaminomethyl modification radical SAM/GNAT enzyme Elp3 [Candidatus Micrarchaeota archaeon]|nr:tRNA uridine(34) 5-carboxymethylaminomethyl modification radical SAM/GNAT enzyme Elp3 [Candidatus Micrarchaeota archaeon]